METGLRLLRRRCGGVRVPLGSGLVAVLAAWVSVMLVPVSAGAIATPPFNRKAPVIAGIPREAHAVKAKKGTWRGSTPLAYGYTWLRCNSAGDECTEVASTAKPRYIPVAEDVGHTLKVIVKAENSFGSATETSEPSAVVVGQVPRKIRGPVISGEAKDGQLLSATSGTWRGTPPFSFTYQWQLCDKYDRECSNIAEATTSSYRLTTSEIGRAVRVVVVATNSVGTGKVTSVQTAEILEGPPVDLSSPTISGVPEEGATLTASTGTWVGTGPLAFTYQWERCSATIGGCEAIAEATEPTYTPGPADLDAKLEVVVSAHNKVDEAGVSATSAETEPVVA